MSWTETIYIRFRIRFDFDYGLLTVNLLLFRTKIMVITHCTFKDISQLIFRSSSYSGEWFWLLSYTVFKHIGLLIQASGNWSKVPWQCLNTYTCVYLCTCDQEQRGMLFDMVYASTGKGKSRVKKRDRTAEL